MTDDKSQIAINIHDVLASIAGAVRNCGRDPDSVHLVAVSKTMPVEKIKAAILAGHTVFGENYIQDAVKKIADIHDDTVRWHFIGHLQTNKAKFAVDHFDLIHTVDSVKLASAINRQAEKIRKIQSILIQVNISGESSKFGINKEETMDVIRRLSEMDHVAVKGLMTMPPFSNDPEKARPFFKALADLREDIRQKAIPGIDMAELSMGMSSDYAVAIAEGATLVRIGTSIFGERK